MLGLLHPTRRAMLLMVHMVTLNFNTRTNSALSATGLRNNKGSGNNVVANANCTPDFTPGKRSDEELYNVSLTKDQYGHSPYFIDILDYFGTNGTQDTLNSSNGPTATCDLSPNPTASMTSPYVPPAPLTVNQPHVLQQTKPRRSTRCHKPPKHMNDYVHYIPQLKTYVPQNSNTLPSKLFSLITTTWLIGL
ncbi:hypothetical protein H5410_048067 [Solanum commersonii]|uniref:Uncharacterized protein n=1 Tax=Solanum commersonii TaxID=4109 RepID=A0A9J5XH05_SOLCO|nr:hypothetical protein H5410_048067 [Solanum commersonii]